MASHVASVLLVRHARSTANDDPRVYRVIPDHAIPLSRPEGDSDVKLAAAAVARMGLAPERLTSWCSPYLRCRQTEELVLAAAFGAHAATVRRRSTFLVREQEFGDWDTLTEEEIERADPTRFARRKLLTDNYGRFYFRYPNGESRADVTQRLTLFIAKLHRSPSPNHIVFLHGVTQRAFRMSWLDRGVDWFEEEPNPPNASVLLLERGREGPWVERYL